jgi:hypothetical protein
MYVKSNAAIHELNDVALDAISGGATDVMRGVARAVHNATGGPYDDGNLPSLPCWSLDILCRLGF